MPIIGYILADSAHFAQLIERLKLGETLRSNGFTAWITLLVSIFIGMAAGKFAQTILRKLGKALMTRDAVLRGTMFNNAAGPASLALICCGLTLGLSQLTLAPQLLPMRHKTGVLLFTFSLAWLLYNLVDVLDVALRNVTAKTESKLDDQMVPLLRKALRMFLVVIFGLFTAENVFGADITAWVTGLGICGLAVSLAAQESIKNLFGSITIFLDRPFAVGDAVAFCGYEGSVEEIGFRSTKLRTAFGHVVTVPNSKIVDGTVENIARRPNIRRQIDLPLACHTPPEKVEQAARILREILASAEIAGEFDLEKNPPRVFFADITSASLNLRVLYWFASSDYWKFTEHAERFNLKLLHAFDEAEIELAVAGQMLAPHRETKPRVVRAAA
jgi:MscS family membrane protein